MRIVEEKNKKVQPYNFKRPDRISKNQLRSLHFIHDRFARNFSSSSFRIPSNRGRSDARPNGAGQLFGIPRQGVRSHVLSPIKLKPLEGFAALEIEPDIVSPLIDRLLGGEGSPIQTVRRMTRLNRASSRR